ncbi:MAG: hypothetical protein EMLJLAPB_00614 [Candidatus Argoarchaeum ethanivorans]|uniref:Uncharacterized protein n=1 Tax=Candidatus Argoarchaeum ethanivorans TaxID=2608793 RepID=A0A811TDC6_9EURY|nr:MAG: hypothetical protein EMLJLAPB_00614 [Candidatus Argoarchaeum ethanivorans]
MKMNIKQESKSRTKKMAEVDIGRDDFHGKWNYKICPRKS